MTTYVVVGDLHGKLEVVDFALSFGLPVVFVGDYLDSFDRPTADHTYLLHLVMDLVEDGRAFALLGNHEYSYLDPRKYQCSGYRDEIGRVITPDVKNRMRSKLQRALQIGDWLITHAGVSEDWLEMAKELHPDTFAMSENLCDFLYRIPEETFTTVGRARGGVSYGGPVWCDFDKEFKPIEGVRQIFGHTPGRSIRVRYHHMIEDYCVDCLDRDDNFLFIDDTSTKVEWLGRPTEDDGD